MALLWRRHSRRWKIELSARSHKNDHEIVQLKQKGSNGVDKTSRLRDDKICTSSGQSVYKDCRYKFCNKKPYLPKSQDGNIRTTRTTIYHSPLRSSEPVFHLTEHCLFCNKPTCLSGNKSSADFFLSQNVLIFKQL